jgi:hypothetical protein
VRQAIDVEMDTRASDQPVAHLDVAWRASA